MLGTRQFCDFSHLIDPVEFFKKPLLARLYGLLSAGPSSVFGNRKVNKPISKDRPTFCKS